MKTETINIFDKNTHKTLVNGETRNGWINRLTVYFADGEAIIEEIHQSNKSSISCLEFDGQAVSTTLPEVLFDNDIEAIAETLEPLIDSENWEAVKDVMDNIYDHINFYDDYIDGAYEDCETEEEMLKHINKCGHNIKQIAAEIRSGGCEYVYLEEWIESYLENME